jgi:hypothetical protein
VIVGLNHANGEVTGQLDVHAAASRHCKGVWRARNAGISRSHAAGVCAALQDLTKGQKAPTDAFLVANAAHERGEREVCVEGADIGGVLAGYFSDDAK